MDRIMRHPRVQKTINHPHVKKVVNKKTIIWFTVIKLIIYIFTAGFFVFEAMNANAANGLDSSITQVKLANSPVVYYLDHTTGQKKAYVSTNSFRSYGNQFKAIKTISSEKLKKWPDVKFIKAKDGSTIYYIKGNAKSRITDKAVIAKLNATQGSIIKVNPADFLSYKTVSNDKIGLAQAVNSILNSNSTATTNNSADDNARSEAKKSATRASSALLQNNKLAVLTENDSLQEYLVAGSVHNHVARFVFYTGSEAVTVRGLTINLDGIYNRSAIKKITFEVPERNLAMEASFIGRTASTNFNAQDITIPANGEFIVDVYVDINNAEVNNFNISFNLNQDKNIITDVSVGANFPIQSKKFKLINSNGLLGKLTVEELAPATANLMSGTSESIVAKFKFTETSGKEDMVVKKITLKHNGDIASNTFSDYILKDNYNKVIGSAKQISGNRIIFSDFNYTIKKSQSRTMTVLASVNGRDNRKVNFDMSEIVANGQTYGYNVASDIKNDNASQNIIRLNLAIEKDKLVTTKTANKHQSGTVIGNFRLKNTNQTIKIEEFNLSLNKSANAPAITENLYLVNYETGELIDNKQASNPNFNLHGLVLKPNTAIKLAVLANLPEDVQNNDSYWVDYNGFSYVSQDNSYNRDSSSVKGEKFYALNAGIYAFHNEAQPTKELAITRGQKQAKVASFIIEATDTTDVIINRISFKQGSETAGRMLDSTGFNNIKLVINSQTAGKTIASPTSDNYQFDNLNYKLQAGRKIEIKVYADIEKNASVDEVQLALDNIDAISTVTGLEAKISGAGINSNKVRIGSLEAEIKVLSGGNYTPGIKNNNLGSFQITNTGSEAINLKKITLSNRGQKFSSSNGFTNLRLARADNNARLGYVTNPLSEVNKISLGSAKIEAGSTMTILVYIDAKNTAPANDSELFINQIEIAGVNSALTATIDNGTALSVSASASANPTGLSLNWPAASHSISYNFRDANYPFRNYGEHSGIDFIVSQGSSIYSAGNGEVTAVANNSNTDYNFVTISHPNGLVTTYGHLSRVDVKVGDKVMEGQKIGLSGGRPGTVGAGPYTNGAHLHFEVTLNGTLVDPLAYIQ